MWNPEAPPAYFPQPPLPTVVSNQPAAATMLIYVPYSQPPPTLYYDHYTRCYYYCPPSNLLLLPPPPQQDVDYAAPAAIAAAAPPPSALPDASSPLDGPLLPNGEETTVMIKNIPNRYNRRMLMEYVDGHCLLQNQKCTGNDQGCYSAYDFLYLPIDFGRKANKGYAFVNFTSPTAAWNFYLAADNQRWSHCRSRKLATIVGAKLQGLNQLLAHFEPTVFPCHSDDFVPVRFDPPRDGSNKDMVKQWTVGRRRFWQTAKNR